MIHSLTKLSLSLCLLALASCAASGFRGDRAKAQSMGGTTWSNFVIHNLSKMDSYLSYDDQMADVRSALPYASPADQQFLAGVHERMARDKVRAQQREEAQRLKRASYASSSGSNSNYGSGGYGRSSASGGYQGPSAYDKAIQRNQDRAFDDWTRRAASGRQQLPSNPYNR